MRFNKILLAVAAAGVFATPVFAQAAPSKMSKAAMKDEKKEMKKAEKKEDAATKKEDHAEHKSFDMAMGAPKKMLSGVKKISKAQRTQINTIEKKYNTQIATMKKDHMAAEKAGTETDAGLAAKVQTAVDQEKAELRAVLTADQQVKFDANVAKMMK